MTCSYVLTIILTLVICRLLRFNSIIANIHHEPCHPWFEWHLSTLCHKAVSEGDLVFSPSSTLGSFHCSLPPSVSFQGFRWHTTAAGVSGVLHVWAEIGGREQVCCCTVVSKNMIPSYFKAVVLKLGATDALQDHLAVCRGSKYEAVCNI